MKNERRIKAVAIASGASLLASVGIAKGIGTVAPVRGGAPAAAGAASLQRDRAVAQGPSRLLIIRRKQDAPQVVIRRPLYNAPVSPPAPAPAPAPAPVTRTS